MKIFYAARLVDFKDPITFVKAAQLVLEHDFVVAGDGKLMSECRKLAGENVEFLGWVKWEAITELMSEADVFCQLSPFENIWSSSLITAMKHKKAVVCTDVGYTRKFLKDGFHAILIPPRNEVELAKAICTLSNDEDLRKDLGENAFRFAQENLDVKKISKEIHCLLEEVLV